MEVSKVRPQRLLAKCKEKALLLDNATFTNVKSSALKSGKSPEPSAHTSQKEWNIQPVIVCLLI